MPFEFSENFEKSALKKGESDVLTPETPRLRSADDLRRQKQEGPEDMNDLINRRLKGIEGSSEGIIKTGEERFNQIVESTPPEDKNEFERTKQETREKLDSNTDEIRNLSAGAKKEIVGHVSKEIVPKTEQTAERKSQSEKIFENVYDQLKQPPSYFEPEKHVELFLAGLADGAQRHIDEIESRGLTNQQIYQEIRQKMDEYVGRYQNDPRFEKKKEDVSKLYTRLIEHANKLVKQGEVDPRTAKVFLHTLPSLKHIGDYNAITQNNENVEPEKLREKNRNYVEAVEKMWAKQPEGMKQEQDGGFYHFNSHLEGNVKNRIYISAQLSGAPEKVVEAWQAALEETELQDKVYFKLPTGLSKRFETIILYQTDKTKDADIEKLFANFMQKCPAELLNERDMPTGVPLRRGISMAPEPANINTFIRYSGSQENISYNQLIASVSELSFELAYEDAQKRGETKPTPKSLKDSASRYFEQMIKLAGINPETMVPNSQGGKLPAWAEKMSRKSGLIK